jgi:hypothetical protein
MIRSSWTTIVTALVVGAVVAGAAAASAPAASSPYPTRIDFPATQFDAAGVAIPGTGYSPEGIAVSGDTFYAGSTATGEVIKGNLKTGEYTRGFVPASPNQPSDLHRGVLGLLVDDHNRLWGAGSYGMACGVGTQPACPAGITPPRTNYGVLFVWDATTGAQLAQYTLSTAAAKTINDMTISGNSVFVSNTTAPNGPGTEVQFRLQLGPGGALPPGDVPPAAPAAGAVNPAVTVVPSFGYTGADGIDTLPNGNVIMNSVTGTSNGDMVVWNATTNAITPITVTPEPGRIAKPLLSGDGVALDGNILYYPENRTDVALCPAPNSTLPCPGDIAVVRLNPPDFTTATVLTRINSPAGSGLPPLRSPANLEQLGHFIYVISRVLVPNPVIAGATFTQTFIERLDKLPVHATGTAVNATEGAVFRGVVATGTDPSTTGLTATIDWGDGSPTSTGTVVKTGETFSVSGTHTYADDGTHTITVKIDDAATSLNLTSATSTATVASVQSLAHDVLGQATALLAGASKADSNKLNDIVRKLNDSLDSALWVDGDHVDAKHGQQVFDSQKDAVGKLMNLLGNKKSEIPDATLQSMIDDIVHVARIVAERAVADAIAASGDPEKIAQAQDELDEANAQLAAGNFAAAIQNFRQAWKKAQQAG